MVREFSSAALQGCREKARKKTVEWIESLPPAVDDVEKFRLLSEQWNLVKTCSGQCGDNLDPELFVERSNNQQYTESRLNKLMTSFVEGIFRMEALTEAMEKLGCTKVNGTSVAFAACCNQTNEIRVTLDRALIVYQRGPFAIGEVKEPDDALMLRA